MPYRRRIFTTAIILILLAALVIFSRRTMRESVIGLITQPFVALGRTVRQTLQSVSLRRDLREENEALKNTTLRLAIDQALLESTQKENEELKNLLGYQKKTNATIVAARVTARPKDPFTNVIRIDRGALHGLAVDDPVVFGEGVLIGRVSSLGEDSADVLLALDPRSKLEARVLGREDTTGVLEGHGVVYRLRFVPLQAGVNRDDLVITSINASPEPLVIGLVRGIELDTETSFSTLVIEPLHDPFTIQFVGVLVGV